MEHWSAFDDVPMVGMIDRGRCVGRISKSLGYTAFLHC